MKLTPYCTTKNFFLFASAMLFLLILPAVMADSEQYIIPKNGETMQNTTIIISALAIITLLSLTYAISTNGNEKELTKQFLNEQHQAQQKINEQCAQKRMQTQPAYTTDFKTWHANCLMTSPYIAIPVEATP